MLIGTPVGRCCSLTAIMFHLASHALSMMISVAFFTSISMGRLCQLSPIVNTRSSARAPNSGDASVMGLSQHGSAWVPRYDESGRSRPSNEAEEHVESHFVFITVQSSYTHTTHTPTITPWSSPVGHNSSNMKDWNHQTSQTYQ